MSGAPPPGRFRVTLAVNSKVVLHGWWDDPDVAAGKFAGYVRAHQLAETPNASVELAAYDDQNEAWPIDQWPPPAESQDSE
ncbi:hypothetical protein ACTWJ8_40540 (plasmid) [Streptomyces sp. SDT5-1]|uniref:hypothetical protein n=1 Tax=Streptomyces sp. SDT5-1 TaxID=3406418 RepID=UPI003FD5684B